MAAAWLPKAPAVKREIALAVIAGAVAWGVGRALTWYAEKRKARRA